MIDLIQDNNQNKTKLGHKREDEGVVRKNQKTKQSPLCVQWLQDHNMHSENQLHLGQYSSHEKQLQANHNLKI